MSAAPRVVAPLSKAADPLSVLYRLWVVQDGHEGMFLNYRLLLPETILPIRDTCESIPANIPSC